MKQSVLRNVRNLRRDMGNMLFHFTRGRPAGVSMPVPTGQAPLTSLQAPRTPFEVLIEILYTRRLVGTSGFVKGSYQCVSFTEWPVSELPSLFAINMALMQDGLQTRYEPYGIAMFVREFPVNLSALIIYPVPIDGYILCFVISN